MKSYQGLDPVRSLPGLFTRRLLFLNLLNTAPQLPPYLKLNPATRHPFSTTGSCSNTLHKRTSNTPLACPFKAVFSSRSQPDFLVRLFLCFHFCLGNLCSAIITLGYICDYSMRRKVISFILMLVFSATVLPLMQIGELLASNALSEEVHQQAPQILEEKCKAPLYGSDNYLHPKESFHWLYQAQMHSSALLKEMVPKGPAEDILIPPPKA